MWNLERGQICENKLKANIKVMVAVLQKSVPKMSYIARTFLFD